MLHLLSVGTLVLASSLWGAWAPDVPRAQLEAKYGADTQLRVQPEVQIHYKDTGPKDAPVVLMLHGFGSSLQTWDQWAAKLETQYRVIRLDLPGFGLSGPRADRDYSEEADVVVLRQFLDALRVQQLAVVGHSMGGKMAWTLAAAEPERVTKLVLMAPDGYPDDKDIGSRPYAMPVSYTHLRAHETG
jgi:pimeloyl-ACP methyl ester carboxylesterase